MISILLVIVIVILAFGWKKIPELMRGGARGLNEFGGPDGTPPAPPAATFSLAVRSMRSTNDQSAHDSGIDHVAEKN